MAMELSKIDDDIRFLIAELAAIRDNLVSDREGEILHMIAGRVAWQLQEVLAYCDLKEPCRQAGVLGGTVLELHDEYPELEPF